METVFEIGDLVWYEVSKKDKDDWRIPATVVGVTPKRIIVEFAHWSDGHLVQRAARRHRVTHRRFDHAD